MENISYELNEKGTDYVGIKIEKGKNIKIFLPIGYIIDTENTNQKELKKDIRKLLKLLNKKTNINYKTEEQEENDFNVIAAIQIIEDFLEYGLYKQKQKECQLNAKGRINWKKTINVPQLYINGKIIYQNTYKEHINYFFEKEIQEIQKYCLMQISKTIGFLWNFSYVEIINRKFNKYEMIEIINTELKKTNQDQKISMLKNLLGFVQNTNIEKLEKGNIHIKYKEFQYIWQNMIDTFGLKGEKKKEYYPIAGYYNKDGSKKNIKVNPQIPDTIIKEYKNYEDYIFILDAKYYKIGQLPNEYDIFKQVRYEQYIKRKSLKNNVDVKILNAFILPKKIGNEVVQIQNFYAKLEDEKEKIYVVYIDTKSLINNTKQVLQELIEKLVNEDKNSY